VAAARAASQLNDPRLVQIFDADDRPEHPYIVTEWPAGIRLDDLLAVGPLGPGRALSDLPPVASATGAGGRVDLRLARPAHGRYVLIWFTRLPPDTPGTFQASIYDVRLEGAA